MKCQYCGKGAKWVPNEMIYGKRYGKSWMAWWCKPCGAYVGCHKNSHAAMGTLANAELRKVRIMVHDALDFYWKSGIYERDEVYAALKAHYGREIHVGWSDEAMCLELLKTIPKVLKFIRIRNGNQGKKERGNAGDEGDIGGGDSKNRKGGERSCGVGTERKRNNNSSGGKNEAAKSGHKVSIGRIKDAGRLLLQKITGRK